MRLIDADRLLTERMKSMYYHLKNGDIAIPIIDIETAPTVDAEPKWVPVSNGLPKEDGVYLISRKGEVFMAKYHTNADYEMDIDAWLPLPKPYEVTE